MAIVNKRPQQPATRRPQPSPHWQPGDIAFLKWADVFNQDERTELIESGRLYSKATGHPVIILASSDDSRHYIVTTVSAYSSGPSNNYLPPWEQNAHRRKDIDGFRAFEGSARPNNKFEPLRLADNKQWPKIETSWVYIYHPYLVPATTLIQYTKSQSQLRMAPESLQDLIGHMEARCRRFRQQKAEIKAMVTPTQPATGSLPKKPVGKENTRGLAKSQANTAPQKPQPTRTANIVRPEPLWSTVAANAVAAKPKAVPPV